MASRKKDGCLDWEGMIGGGENARGIVNINPTGNQVGTEPRDLMGRQDYEFGPSLNGDRFKAFGYDFGAEMGGEGGPFAGMTEPARRRK